MTDSKPFWASKTLWVNLIALAAAIAAGFGLDLGLDAETQSTIVAGIMAVINIVMRAGATHRLTAKKSGRAT